MDEQLENFLVDFGRIAELSSRGARPTAGGEPLLKVLSEHLGVAVQELPVIAEEIANHRLVDADIAAEGVASGDPEHRLIGVGGGQQRQHSSFADLVQNSLMYQALPVGQPDFINLATGPDANRQVVGFGIRLFRYHGVPLAALQRSASPQFGSESAAIEVIGAVAHATADFLAEIRTYLTDNSVIKGQVVSFAPNDYHSGGAGVTFHERPALNQRDIILPPSVLDRVHEHVLGIAAHRDSLLAHGQHLKRGVLLYGPPGTGKTHTVRYLLSCSEGTTAILLSGGSLAFIAEAARMARAMAPSVVVLEDVDLIAEDRSFGAGPQPLLFEVLDALDGLDNDVDVAFLLTTNRVQALERALAQRPGRVDLAVEIPLPDEENRSDLLRLYAPSDAFSDAALAAAANRTEGTTASFAKELMRRTVLNATMAGAEPTDAHLAAAVEDLMSEGEALTRSLLGSGVGVGDDDGYDEGYGEGGYVEDGFPPAPFGPQPGVAYSSSYQPPGP